MKREAGLNGTDEVDLQRYMTKADILMSLQRRFLLAYDLEHKYKEELLSPAEIQKKIQKMLTNDDIKDKYPRELYDAHLAEIDDKRSKFSPEFSHDECVEFFSELKDMSWLQEHFDFLQKSFEKPNLENPTDLEDPD